MEIALEVIWSGCGMGRDLVTDCVVQSPGVQTAALEVRDGRGGVARASAVVEGVNQPPWIRLPRTGVPDPAPPNTVYNLAGAQPEDPDGDEDANTLCSRVSYSISGACSTGRPSCGGVGDVFDWDIRTLSGPGTCTIETRTRDSWGLEASDRWVFQVR